MKNLPRNRHLARGKIDFIDPVCVECGQLGKLVSGAVAYPRQPDRANQAFYRCDCGALVSCHPGTAIAAGRPARAETRNLRRLAHQALDAIWGRHRSRMGAGYARAKAYKWLAGELGIRKQDCHIGAMDAEQCRRVIELCGARALKEAA